MQPRTSSKNKSIQRLLIVLSAFLVFSGGYSYSQSHKTGKPMMAAKNGTADYLDKNDPIYKSIKGRSITDLKQSAKKSDPESMENKAIAAKITTWPEEKQNELQALGEQSRNDYAAATQFDVETFLLVFSEFGKMDQKKIAGDYDIRIQHIGDGTYIAEFWEDGLAVNSEENAVVYAHELAVSGYAKKHPESDVGNVEVIKNNYALTRKSITTGKQERYTKMMALLYTIDKNGGVIFHDPGQPMIDFVNNNSK
ncbi:MAG: hypothetical protein EHM64_00910 [Ignavibacteriae bacterium]|nr:MAG: hypothetical protein EHM64_00910 [Ignavibacteriota bacterium]